MRSKNKVLTHCVAVLVASVLAGPALSQETAQQPAQQNDQQAPTIKSEVGLVNVFATVRDRKKHIVPDLKKEDFRVFENDQEQKIAFFT
ncbi:MAG TPA: hypothetical protein VF749_00545, partial [Candidatus Acidoferrum sp.]